MITTGVPGSGQDGEGVVNAKEKLPKYYPKDKYTFFETAEELVSLPRKLVNDYKLNTITEKRRLVSFLMMLNPTTVVYFRPRTPLDTLMWQRWCSKM